MKRAAAVVVGVILLMGCVPGSEGAHPTSPPVTPQPLLDSATAAGLLLRSEGPDLRTAGSCDTLLAYFIEQALEQVGPWGLGGHGPYELVDETTAAETASDDGQSSVGGSAEPTSTNVQVEGVDEGDYVKADRDRLYVLTDNRLRVFSTAGDTVAELGSVDIGRNTGGGEMLIDGDQLVVVSGAFGLAGRGPQPLSTEDVIWPVGTSFVQVTLVDVSDGSEPTVSETVTLDGSLVSTRLVSGHLRVVLNASPVGLVWVTPEGSGLRSEREATERNRAVVRASTIDNWLPYFVTGSGGEGTAVECEDVLVPPEPSGLGTLSILDFALEAGIESWQAASVVASGSTVYATPDRTYVATQVWIEPVEMDDGIRQFDTHVTRVHRFDTEVDTEIEYRASGDVDGFLLNQFALDEHEGFLRVASTSGPDWWGGRGEDSVSQVTVLETRGRRLVEVGVVGGLGETETIRSVRFMGDVGYVVTFRQTDPLYVLDLSEPTAPEMTGELKIPGYSAYLHPVGDGKLIGVGQDADPDTGQVHGLQVSLFDVSDPRDPLRVGTYALGPDGTGVAGTGSGGPLPGADVERWISSAVEWDHKAFTRAGDVALVPYEGWEWSRTDRGGDFTETMRHGLIVVDWSDGTLSRSRTLPIFEGKSGADSGFAPQRTVVKGDVVYAVGYSGISVIDLESGELLTQLRFGRG